MRLIGVMLIITLVAVAVIFFALAQVGLFTWVGGMVEKAVEPFKRGDNKNQKQGAVKENE